MCVVRSELLLWSHNSHTIIGAEGNCVNSASAIEQRELSERNDLSRERLPVAH